MKNNKDIKWKSNGPGSWVTSDGEASIYEHGEDGMFRVWAMGRYQICLTLGEAKEFARTCFVNKSP